MVKIVKGASRNGKFNGATTDPNLLKYGVVEVMHKFHLSYPRAKKAMQSVYREKLQNGETESLNQIMEEKNADRLLQSLVRTETKYPHIFRRMFSGSRNMASTGRYFRMSREAVRQFKRNFIDYSHLTSILPSKVLNEVEELASE